MASSIRSANFRPAQDRIVGGCVSYFQVRQGLYIPRVEQQRRRPHAVARNSRLVRQCEDPSCAQWPRQGSLSFIPIRRRRITRGAVTRTEGARVCHNGRCGGRIHWFYECPPERWSACDPPSKIGASCGPQQVVRLTVTPVHRCSSVIRTTSISLHLASSTIVSTHITYASVLDHVDRTPCW